MATMIASPPDEKTSQASKPSGRQGESARTPRGRRGNHVWGALLLA